MEQLVAAGERVGVADLRYSSEGDGDGDEQRYLAACAPRLTEILARVGGGGGELLTSDALAAGIRDRLRGAEKRVSGTGVSLAVDGGQTGLRLRLRRPGREPVTVEVSGFAYAAGDPVEVITGLVATAWQRLPPPGRSPVDRVGLGLTGEYGDRLPRLASAVAAICGAREIRIAHDSLTAHLGALDGQPGVVVAAGTGTVALALAPDGTATRIDGWGYVLGDGGSGFAVGRAALRAVLAAHDGRGPSTALTTLATNRFGPLDDLPRWLYTRPDLAAQVASFTPDTVAAARDGDGAAAAVWREAVDDLVATTVAAARHAQDACLVSYTGGMFAVTDLVLTPWRHAVAEHLPRWQVVPPAGNALDGADLLIRDIERPPWADHLEFFCPPHV